ncbi:MAG: serine/threonine protein kinase [Lentisphaeria bacterium]|nr:serine/threonine protein kinase [Lentisphaeria bacterium]
MTRPAHKPIPADATEDLSRGGALDRAAARGPLPGRPVAPEFRHLRLPGCTLLSALGRGGMGMVFLARQERLQRLVAVKMLSADSSRDAEYIRHLEREARTLATLAHPNIVGCHDIVTTAEGTFLIMQYVPGQLSVHDLLARFRVLPEAVVARIALDTARGLAHAHAKGICHRDVKPHNLLIHREDPQPPATPYDVFCTPQARVMICDFGIARETVATPGQSPATFGSPAYMAPEQAFDPTHVDFRADLYALGVTLYQLLTGRRPFPGETARDVLHAKRSEDLPDPNASGVFVTEEATHILTRMGASDPGRRYHSYAALVSDLERWFGMHHATAHGAILGRYPPSFWRGLAAGTIAGALLLAALGGVRLREHILPKPISMASTLGYWQGDRSAWRVTRADSETKGAALTGLPLASPLGLKRTVEPGFRVRLRMRLPSDGSASCALRQDGADRLALCWSRRNRACAFTLHADGREVPVVEIPEREGLAWLALDLRLQERQVDVFADGKLRAVAPLSHGLGKAHLVLEVRDGHVAQFTDIWITEGR